MDSSGSHKVFKLEELARAAGTSARTVRYYVQRGLLPPPAFKGKDTAYSAEHLVRLRAIRKLQDAYLPLDAIAVELERRSVAEIEQVAEGKALPRQMGEPRASPGSTDAPAQAAEPDDGGMGDERLFRRVELAPGVELTFADDAPDASRRLVARILRQARGVERGEEEG